MSLIEHAKRELLALGYDPNDAEDGPNKWIQENILELINTFAEQGHSGGSAPYCLQLFTKLASWEPAKPLTGEDSEWDEVENSRDGLLFQNNHCSRVFKQDGTVYDVDGRVFRDSDGSRWNSAGSAKRIKFPYTPKSPRVVASRWRWIFQLWNRTWR